MEKIDLIQNLKIGEIKTIKGTRSFSKKFTYSCSTRSILWSLQDSIKQRLVLLGIEPEWEAKFTLHSYGFRK